MTTPDASILPVFPLPSAVLFPHTVLPLHVFEQRYREMVRDVKDGERRIVIALLEPGYGKAYLGSPAIHAVGTLGRIDDLRPLDDGRFIFNLVGERRVRLEELPSEKPYRLVRATPHPERVVDDAAPGLGREKIELLASHGMLMRELGAHDCANLVLDSSIPYEHAVNGCCANLPADAALRQELLELDDPRERRRRVAELIDDVLRQVLELKSAGDAPAGDVN